MTRRTSLAVIPLLALLVLSSMLRAQPAQPPTLDQILQRLEANLRSYDANVPSFFCDEHAISTVRPQQAKQDSVTDSVFRLKRVLNPGHASTLDESRDIVTVNGQPASGNDISGPSIVHGAFSGGLSFVSLDQKACMNYTLQQIKPRDAGKPYVIRFTSLSASQRPSDCTLPEGANGRVVIDPATMQITQMELHAPHRVRIAAGSEDYGIIYPQVVGVWDLSVDYAPVVLDGQSFWLPTAINSKVTANFADGTATWSFKSAYRNYHKLEVTSRILPSAGPPAP